MTLRVFLFLIGALLFDGHALACSPVNTVFSNAETVEFARNQVRDATAIIDAEVVNYVPPDNARQHGSYSRLRAIRVLKGPRRQFFNVEASSTCDIELRMVGARYRILLQEGPVHYRATLGGNGLFGGNARVFDREVDRLLKSPRARNLAHPGVASPPQPD